MAQDQRSIADICNDALAKRAAKGGRVRFQAQDTVRDVSSLRRVAIEAACPHCHEMIAMGVPVCPECSRRIWWGR